MSSGGLQDWQTQYPELFALHGQPTSPAPATPGLDWPSLLAACPEAQRHHLERLAALVGQHPEVSLRLAAPGLVSLAAPPAWVAAHAVDYAHAVVTLHEEPGRSAVRAHLLPALEVS